MAVAFDAASTGGVASGAIATWNHTSVSGTPSAVGVAVLHYQDGVNAVPTATFGGTSLGAAKVQSIGYTPGGVACRLYIFGLGSPASGLQAVVVTSDAGAFMACGAVTVTGSDPSTIFSHTSSSTGTAVATLSSTCTSATGELVMDILGVSFNSTNITAGGGQTAQWGPTTEGGILSSGSTAPGATSITMSWTWTNVSDAGICAASFKMAGAAPAGDTFGPSMRLVQMKRKSIGWTPLSDHRRRVLRPNRSLWTPQKLVLLKHFKKAA